jgi:hypothetical protein
VYDSMIQKRGRVDLFVVDTKVCVFHTLLLTLHLNQRNSCDRTFVLWPDGERMGVDQGNRVAWHGMACL